MAEDKEVDVLIKQSLKNGHLNVEQTKLSIERTFLSYIRTALAVLVAGATLIQFFENRSFRLIGFGLIPIAILLLIIGIVRIKKKRTRIEDLLGGDADD